MYRKMSANITSTAKSEQYYNIVIVFGCFLMPYLPINYGTVSNEKKIL